MELLQYIDTKYREIITKYHSFGKEISMALGMDRDAKAHVFYTRLIEKAERKGRKTGRPFFYEYHHMRKKAEGWLERLQVQ